MWVRAITPIPASRIIDNVPEIAGLELERWVHVLQVQPRFINPGKAPEGFIESFSRSKLIPLTSILEGLTRISPECAVDSCR